MERQMDNEELFVQSCGCVLEMPHGRVRSRCPEGERLGDELMAIDFSQPFPDVQSIFETPQARAYWEHFRELTEERIRKGYRRTFVSAGRQP